MGPRDVGRLLAVGEIANDRDSPRLGREPAVRVQPYRACRACDPCAASLTTLWVFVGVSIRPVAFDPPELPRAINPSRIGAIARAVLRDSRCRKSDTRERERETSKRGKERRRRTSPNIRAKNEIHAPGGCATTSPLTRFVSWHDENIERR